jgi:hypothetical protein
MMQAIRALLMKRLARRECSLRREAGQHVKVTSEAQSRARAESRCEETGEAAPRVGLT